MTDSPTILIAEDCEQDIEMLLRAFQILGVQNLIQIVKNGEQAIDYLAGRGCYGDRNQFPIPEIVLLDILMPKKSGLEVLHYIKELPLYSKLLVVVFTGLAENQYIDKAYRAGAHSFLRKPVSIEELQNLATFYKTFWKTTKAYVPLTGVT